jgi:uncharacterized protein (TIGR02466 family)
VYNSYSEFLFPRQVIVSDSENFSSYRDHLINLCYKEMEKDPVGVQLSNVGGWQSRSDLILDNSDFEFLFEDLDGNLEHCMNNEFGISENSNLTILNAWINISGKYNYNTTHTHPLSMISAVYYVKCPEECGDLVFLPDFNDAIDYEFRNDNMKEFAKMYGSYEIKPKEGRLVIFPANLLHHVHVNQSNDDRISISFNLSF